MIQFEMRSPIGPLYLVATARGLRSAHFSRSSVPTVTSFEGSEPALEHLAHAVRELEAYFAGQLRTFTVTLDTEGSPFQAKVWNELRRIPFGATPSYAEIARRIGHPKAVRAVGTANGRNPIAIIVPCHRVIASNGKLGGYAGGLEIKARLLSLEGAGVIGSAVAS